MLTWAIEYPWFTFAIAITVLFITDSIVANILKFIMTNKILKERRNEIKRLGNKSDM